MKNSPRALITPSDVGPLHASASTGGLSRQSGDRRYQRGGRPVTTRETSGGGSRVVTTEGDAGVSRRTGMPGAISRARADKPFCRGVLLAIFAAMGLIAFSTACSGSRELTRRHARDLIEGAGDFRRPISVVLPGKRDQPTRAKATDEAEGEARERAFDEYAHSHTEMAVFSQLGLINFTATLIEGPSPEHEWWRFSVEPVLTDKGGREAVEEPAGSGRKGIAIARREVIEVTGLTAPKEGAARAEFTWKEVPTPAGEAFDPTGDTYRALPEWVRRDLAGPASGLGKGLERKYGVARKGSALLRLYDDGWRVQHLQF